MTRSQLFLSVSVTLSALTIWLYVLVLIQPDRTDLLLMTTFFISLTVWLGSLLAGLFYWVKRRQSHNEVIYAHIRPSLRQGFLIATTIAILLLLQLLRVISVWDAIIVVLVAVAFEIAAQQSHPSYKGKL